MTDATTATISTKSTPTLLRVGGAGLIVTVIATVITWQTAPEYWIHALVSGLANAIAGGVLGVWLERGAVGEMRVFTMRWFAASGIRAGVLLFGSIIIILLTNKQSATPVLLTGVAVYFIVLYLDTRLVRRALDLGYAPESAEPRDVTDPATPEIAEATT